MTQQNQPKVTWSIGNGKTLRFNVYDLETNWYDVPGLYIFCYQTMNSWPALYIGQTDNFQKRFANHERLPEAIRRGATHIHALTVNEQANRDAWERTLITIYQPAMNTQHAA